MEIKITNGTDGELYYGIIHRTTWDDEKNPTVDFLRIPIYGENLENAWDTLRVIVQHFDNVQADIFQDVEAPVFEVDLIASGVYPSNLKL